MKDSGAPRFAQPRRPTHLGVPSLILAALALACAPPAPAATFLVPGDYKTIQAAIDAAQTSDTISVAAGVYEENLKFKSGVHLAGEKDNKTIVRASALRGPALNVEKCAGGSIRSMVFEHVDRENLPPDDENRPSAVRLIASPVRLSDCRILNGAAKGIVIGGGGAPVVENCVVERSFWHGVMVAEAGTSPTLRANTIRESGYSGIAFLAGSNGSALANRCESNVWHGIVVAGANSNPSLRGNECLSNQRNGIQFEEGARGRALDNICRANLYNGIATSGAGATPHIQSNKCHQNKNSGIYIDTGSRPTVEANVIRENDNQGIVVSGLNAAPLLRRNQSTKNRANGVYYEKSAAGVAEGNIFEENIWSGILVDGQGTGPTLRANECNRNGYAGIHYRNNASGVAESNVCKDNKQKAIAVYGLDTVPILRDNQTTPDRWMERADVAQRLLKNRYEELDALADKARSEKMRYPNTEWQLGEFYEYFDSAGRGAKAADRDQITDLVKRWGEARPDSLTPKIALARLYTAYAWTERGSGWAYTVTDEGWKGFGENLQKAYEKLKEAELETPQDPELYVSLLTIGMGMSATDQMMDLWVKKGAAIEPLYYPLYYARAYSLLPRWGGAPGELEAFAASAADSVKDKDGQALYARIVMAVSRYVGTNEFRENHSFDWERVELGFRDAIRLYPASAKELKNQFCWFAAWNMKRDTARQLFAELGEDVDEGYWGDAARTTRWKGWAEGKSDDFPGGTPLHDAARKDEVVAARKLLEAGTNPNVRDIAGETPLLRAVKYDGIHVLAILLDHGADYDMADNSGETPLSAAVRKDKSEAAQLLLNAGANPDAISQDGYTPLNVAIYGGKVELARLLLERGADPNATVRSGYTPLLRAVREPKFAALVPLLIEKGADINRAGPEEWTPLGMALSNKDEAQARFLIERGADVNRVSAKDWTPFVTAVAKGLNNTARLLLERGADVNYATRHNTGYSPLQYAVNTGNNDMVRVILAVKGVNPTPVADNGVTPLHTAVRKQNREAVELLLKAGARLDIKDARGETPLAQAEKAGQEELAALMRPYLNQAASRSAAQPPPEPASGPVLPEMR